MVYSDVVKVYGPYKAKDSRLRVVLAFKDGSKKTVSYPKYIMEIHLGRYLTIDETVDHIDCDPLNNDLTNLRVLSRSDHSKQDAVHNHVSPVICVICNQEFIPTRHQVSDRTRKKVRRSGLYCSKKCAGIASHLLDLQTQEITVTKYKPKSLYLSESNKGMESNSVKPVVNGDTEPSSDKSEKV